MRGLTIIKIICISFIVTLAINVFILAQDEYVLLSNRIADQETKLVNLKELSRTMIINKALDIEEDKQQLGQLKEVKDEESNVAENNKEDAEDKE